MPKNNDLFVDTSGWVYYIDQLDALHPEVIKHIHRVLYKKQHLVTTNYIMAELVALLSSRYHISRNRLVEIIRVLRREPFIKIVHIGKDVDDEAWKLLETRLDKEWSLVDASSFVVTKRLGMMYALTGDHHFTQAGFIQVPDGL